MGSLLNFICEKTWAQPNGLEGPCTKGPLSNEIILKYNHSRTEFFEFKEGYKNLIVFEFTSIDKFVNQYKRKDKLLELKKKGAKIVFSFLSDPCYDESLEATKHWWEELDPIIIGGTPTSKFGYQFDYFIESTINYLDKAFGNKNECGYISEKLKQNQLEFFRSNYFLCFNRQLEGKYARLRLFYDYFDHKLHENSCFSFLNKFNYEQIDTIHDELYKNMSKNIDSLYEPLKLTKEQQFDQDLLRVFDIYDNLKYYTDVDWFKKLNIISLRRLYMEVQDIWRFRAGLNNITRNNIVPGANIFLLRKYELYKLNLNQLRYTLLNEMETIATRGVTQSDKVLGALFMITALVIVSPRARLAYPDLYQTPAF